MMRARHALQQLIAHHAMDQVGARLQPEDGVAELDLAGAAGIRCLHRSLHGYCPPPAAGASAAAPPPALRNEPGLGAFSGRARLTASRTNTQLPLLPGTAPRTRISPLSLSVSTTSRFCVVTCTLPMWPAIFLPLNTLPGSWR